MYFCYFLIGSIFGSFLCLVAERVPKQHSIIKPASHCNFCQKKLIFFELIPLFSSLLLGFRCRHCHVKLPTIYFFSELVCGLLFGAVLSQAHSLENGYHLLLLVMFLLLSLTDIYYLQVEPKLFYPLFFIICGLHFYSKRPFYLFPAFCILIALVFFNYLLHNSIGGGDILLISALSLLLKTQLILHLLFIASCSGLLFLLFSSLLTKKKMIQLPFVPFLSLGLFYVLYF